MTTLYIDELDAGCTRTNFTLSSGAGYNNSYAFSNNVAAVGIFAFTGLTPGASYRIAATWVEAGNRSTTAHYTVKDTDGTTTLANYGPINQVNAASADFSATGSTGGAVNFQYLNAGSITVTGTTASVTVSFADGYCIIDAIALVLQGGGSPATTYTVSAPGTTAKVGQPILCTVNLVGGTVTTPIVITPAASHSGTISGTVTIGTSSSTGSFVYTPTLTGAEALSFTHTGGNGGMTDAATRNTTVAAVNRISFVGNALAYYPPRGWKVLGSSIVTAAPGNYCKACFTGTTLSIEVDVSALRAGGVSGYPTLRIRADEQDYSVTLTDPQVDLLIIPVTLNSAYNSTSHKVQIFYDLRQVLNDDYVTVGAGYPVAAVVIKSLVLDAGATLVSMAGTPLAVRPKLADVYGDSLAEGWQVVSNASGTWVDTLCLGIDAEYSVKGVAQQGWTRAGTAGLPAFGTDWNLFYSGVSKLSAGVYIGAAPDFQIVWHGQNDYTTPASITGTLLNPVLAAMRTAAPLSRIILGIPFGFTATNYGATARANLLSIYNTFAASDGHTTVLDMGPGSAEGVQGIASFCSGDGIHFNDARTKEIGSLAAGRILRSAPSSGGRRPSVRGTGF